MTITHDFKVDEHPILEYMSISYAELSSTVSNTDCIYSSTSLLSLHADSTNDFLKNKIEELELQPAERDDQIKSLQERVAICSRESLELWGGLKLINIIRQPDERTTFYTSPRTWNRFGIIFKLCEPAIAQISKHSKTQSKLSFQEQLLLTLMSFVFI